MRKTDIFFPRRMIFRNWEVQSSDLETSVRLSSYISYHKRRLSLMSQGAINFGEVSVSVEAKQQQQQPKNKRKKHKHLFSIIFSTFFSSLSVHSFPHHTYDRWKNTAPLTCEEVVLRNKTMENDEKRFSFTLHTQKEMKVSRVFSVTKKKYEKNYEKNIPNDVVMMMISHFKWILSIGD